MEKIVNGFLVFKKDDWVVIGDAKRPEGDQLLLSKGEDGLLRVTIKSKMLQQNSFSLDSEALQAALEMLAEDDESVPTQINCRECLDHPKTTSFLPMNPERTFCQKVGADLNDLPDQKCPLDKPERLRDEYLDRLEDGG